MNRLIDLGQVFTSEKIAEFMISLFTIQKEGAFLDPCFGDGAFIKAAKKFNFNNIEGYEIDSKLFDESKLDLSSANLYNEDFLLSKRQKKYDAIIMNPPYIRQEKIDDLKEYGITKVNLRRNKLFSCLPGNANIYMYFIIKAISLLKKNGELIVIFPSSWIKAKNGERFKEHITSKCTVEKEIHVTGEIFEKDALVEVVVLKLVKGKHEFSCTDEYLEMKNGNLIKRNSGNESIDFGFDTEFIELANIRRGLTTGYNEMFINPSLIGEYSHRNIFNIISTPKSIDGYSTKNAKLDKILIIENDSIDKEIQDYINHYKLLIVENGKPKTLFNKIMKDERWYTLKKIDSKGIIFSYFVRNDMKFVLNETDYLVRDNFYIIYPKIDKLLLFALLNNYYTYLQLELSGKKYGAGLLKIQRYDIENLLFPTINELGETDVITLKELSKRIIEGEQKSLIEEITRIISKYSFVPFEEVIDKYRHEIKHRLE